MNYIIKQVSAKITYNTELPYHIQIGSVQGIGDTPRSAVIVALSVGGLIPNNIRNDNEAIQEYLERNYDDTPNRNILINIIKRNSI